MPLPPRASVVSLPTLALLMAFGLAQAGVERQAQAARIPHRTRHDPKHQVEALEEQWRSAQLTADVAAMDKLLAADYIGISANGEVLTKPQQLEHLRNRAPGALSTLRMSDTKVKLIGTTAIVTSLAQVGGPGDHGPADHGPMEGYFRYTRVYERLASGDWRITNFEATRIPPNKKRSRDGRGDARTDKDKPDANQ